MREILFKAKRIDNGEWVEGYLLKYKKDCYICPKPYECMDGYSSLQGQHYGFGDFVLVDKITICQYTGLTDKNGNKIWENDIVKSGGNLVIVWNKSLASFCLVKEGWAFKHFFGEALYPFECEVVGNVFDNSELLKGE